MPKKKKQPYSKVQVGDTVRLTSGRIGLVRFKGKTSFSVGEWYGIELYNSDSRHDGMISAKRYFRCPRNRGIFCRRDIIQSLVDPREAQKNQRAFHGNRTQRSAFRQNKPRPAPAKKPAAFSKVQKHKNSQSNIIIASPKGEGKKKRQSKEISPASVKNKKGGTSVITVTQPSNGRTNANANENQSPNVGKKRPSDNNNTNNDNSDKPGDDGLPPSNPDLPSISSVSKEANDASEKSKTTEKSTKKGKKEKSNTSSKKSKKAGATGGVTDMSRLGAMPSAELRNMLPSLSRNNTSYAKNRMSFGMDPVFTRLDRQRSKLSEHGLANQDQTIVAVRLSRSLSHQHTASGQIPSIIGGGLSLRTQQFDEADFDDEEDEKVSTGRKKRRSNTRRRSSSGGNSAPDEDDILGALVPVKKKRSKHKKDPKYGATLSPVAAPAHGRMVSFDEEINIHDDDISDEDGTRSSKPTSPAGGKVASSPGTPFEQAETISPRTGAQRAQGNMKRLSQEFIAQGASSKLLKTGGGLKSHKQRRSILTVYAKYPTQADYPDLTDYRNETLIADFITSDAYDKYRSLTTKPYGYTLDDAIQCACFYMPDPIGFRLGDPQSYHCFSDLIDELLIILHNDFNPRDPFVKHKRDHDWTKLLDTSKLNSTALTQGAAVGAGNALTQHTQLALMRARSQSSHSSTSTNTPKAIQSKSKAIIPLSSTFSISEDATQSESDLPPVTSRDRSRSSVTSGEQRSSSTTRSHKHKRKESRGGHRIKRSRSKKANSITEGLPSLEIINAEEALTRSKTAPPPKNGEGGDMEHAEEIDMTPKAADASPSVQRQNKRKRKMKRSRHVRNNSSFLINSIKLLDPDYVVQCRMHISRNIHGFRFMSAITRAERRAIEAMVSRVLQSGDGVLKGRYKPYSAINETKAAQLIENDKLFPKPDAPGMVLAGYARDWPESRGVFMNHTRNLYVWLNYLEHIHVLSVQNNANIIRCFQRLFEAHNALEKKIIEHQKSFIEEQLQKMREEEEIKFGKPHKETSKKQTNLEKKRRSLLERKLKTLKRKYKTGFVFDERLGYLTSSPQFFGTAMRVFVRVKLPKLIQHNKFNDILVEENLTAYQQNSEVDHFKATTNLFTEFSTINTLMGPPSATSDLGTGVGAMPCSPSPQPKGLPDLMDVKNGDVVHQRSHSVDEITDNPGLPSRKSIEMAVDPSPEPSNVTQTTHHASTSSTSSTSSLSVNRPYGGGFVRMNSPNASDPYAEDDGKSTAEDIDADDINNDDIETVDSTEITLFQTVSLGVSEVQSVQSIIDSVNRLIALEKLLEMGGDLPAKVEESDKEEDDE